MEAELYKELSENDRSAVRELVEECNHADHTNYDTDLDGDFYYIIRNDDKEESGLNSELFAVLSGYLLGETIDGKQVLEVEAFTHPAMRRIGFFSTCYNSLKDDFRNYRIRFMIKSPLYGFDDPEYEHISFESDSGDHDICLGHEAAAGETDYGRAPDEQMIKSAVPFIFPDTYETLCAISAVHLYDELFMEKELARSIADPGDSLCNRFGEVYLSGYNSDTLYLYGLLVYDKYLGRGHGRKLMESVENYEKKGPYKKILLQVSDSNHIAYRLYQHLGYKERERIIYFLV
ncbi:GNAT family N-acetyltransferase [Oribacterium sp. P6A1]|uniref:GNAT family N-acetyltransferase n=1 Tax=Oribacterium sp. P6A1 TaxID=1410612 RepID=UPI00068CAC43|nr:GNAT family N-acetyltransferase [Oribacterium sp. P6A1]